LLFYFVGLCLSLTNAHPQIIPNANKYTAFENITRISKPTLEEFKRDFEVPNKPCIISDVVSEWPAYKKWTPEYLIETSGKEVRFVAGSVHFTMADYFSYANQQADDLPLYLFDKHFARNVPALANDFTVPEYFSEDLFRVMGDARPDFRWIIIGPKLSGSSFHKDPNCTSAWNAVVSGRKKWIMFPPNITPPGNFNSPSRVSLAAG
jgi:hypothetical protein